MVERLPEKDEDYYLNGDGRYHRVEGLPFIDGVCVLIGVPAPCKSILRAMLSRSLRSLPSTRTGRSAPFGQAAPECPRSVP